MMNKMLANINLQTRLALGFCLVMVLMGAVGIFALHQLNTLSDTNLAMYQHPFAVSNAVLRVSGNITKIHEAMEHIPYVASVPGLESAARKISRLDELVLADFALINERFLGKPEMYERAKTLFMEWRPMRDEIIGLMRAGRKIESLALENGICQRHVKKLGQAVAEVNAFAQKKAAYFRTYAEDSAKQASYLLVGLLSLAILLCLSFTVIITRKVVGIVELEQTKSRLKIYESIISQLKDSAVWLDPQGYIIHTNESACRNLGYSNEELLAMSLPEVDTGVPAETWPQYWDDLKEAGHLVIESRYRRKNGEVFPVEIYLDYLMINEDAFISLVARDITERELVREKLQRFNQELEELVDQRTAELAAANKELEAFAYSVSHDLRAPLRAISGFSQIVLEDYHDKLDPEGQDFLRRIRKAGNNMGQLIDDILKLSRITRVDMDYQNVDLSRLVEDITRQLVEDDPQRNADFVIHPNLTVKGDEVLLRVLLDNVLRNAWKFTTNQPTTKIEFGSQEQPRHSGDGGRPVKVYYVKDNGVGFDSKYESKLFQPFQRLHSQEEFPGTGVGLATVQRVVNRHGGKVWAESQEGSGATFYFSLGSS
jgi:PAS domain S-box-containing protein